MSSSPPEASPPYEFTSVWGRAEVLTPRVLEAATISSLPNNDVITILFDQATPEPNRIESPPQQQQAIGSPPLEFDSPPQPSSAVWHGALQIPLALAAGTRAVWFKSDLRLFVTKDAGVRILLLADLAGQSFVKEFPYAETVGVDSPDGGIRTFQFVHQAQTLPADRYTFSLVMLVERQTGDEFARVFLDSLDVQVNPNLQHQAAPNPPTDSPPS